MCYGRLGGFWIWCHLVMSDCRYRYNNKHGATTNEMSKGNTCRSTGSPTDERSMHAKWCAREWMIMQRYVHRWMDEKTCKMCSRTDEWMNMHLSWTYEPVMLSNIQAMSNVTRKHQENQWPSKTLHTFPCKGEAMIHHEKIHHRVALQIDMYAINNTNVQTLSCQVVSWVMSCKFLLWAMFSINVM